MICRMDSSFHCPECEKVHSRDTTICPRCGAMVFAGDSGFSRHWLLILFLVAFAAGTVLSVLRTQGG